MPYLDEDIDGVGQDGYLSGSYRRVLIRLLMPHDAESKQIWLETRSICGDARVIRYMLAVFVLLPVYIAFDKGLPSRP